MILTTIWPEDVPKVRQCLGMTEDGLRQDVETLKSWLRKQPHLSPLVGINEDQWLRNYLVMNKNSVERAKAALDHYFSLKWTAPEFYKNRDMSDDRMTKSFNNTCIAFMPGLTEEGYRVVVYSHFTDDSTNFQPLDVIIRLISMADVCLAEGVDRVSDIIILDLLNSKISHLAKYNLNDLRNLFDFGWKAYPERVAAIHIINPPYIIEMVLNVFKPFLKQKMRDRIQIHNTVEGLKDYIPLASIPCDYGGQGPSSREMNKAWQSKLIESRTLLDTVATHRSREDMRPHHDKETMSFTDLGIDGTFRKLTLD